MKRKTAVKAVMAGITLLSLLSGCAQEGKQEKKTEEGLEKVTVILDYVTNTNHTGLYAALDQGYYKEVGLDVEIIEPTEGAAAALIANGKGDFGISYQEDVTVARTSAEQLPIKAIAAIVQHNTSGFASYKEKGITSVKDFEKKTYIGWGGPGEAAVLEAVMKEAGADFGTLDIVVTDGAGFEVLRDRGDIMWFYEGWDCVKAELSNFPIHYMELRQLDKRLDIYTPVIITSDKMIDENPLLISRFMEATEKGYEYAIEYPEESAEILHSFAPEYDLELLIKSQIYLSGKYKEDAEHWGWMKDEVWDQYTQFLEEYGIISDKIPAKECYTNEFLSGQN